MDDTPRTDIDPSPSNASDATRKHIRGSTLLLVGRVVMLGLNFFVQVLMVRYLSKTDFGAFSYALSFVSMAAVVALFGLDKAVARFTPIYHEQKDYRRMFGTVVLTFFFIVAVGVLVIAATMLFRDQIITRLGGDPLSLSVLLIVILIAPINALESYFQDLMAVFAKPRSIFIRRYIIGPGLKLLAVVLVVLFRGSILHLAAGYVLGSLLGMFLYIWIMYQVFREQGLLAHFHWNQLIFPVGDLFRFSVPLLSTDFLHILRNQAVVLFLQYFGSAVDVAEYRAVVPVAGMNLTVMQSFKSLYTPISARLFARDDRQGINELYWKTATWIALLTFPIFVATFSLAEPVTVLLFGERYAQSGVILALLAFGNYFNAALGFNSYTLRVYGRVKYIVIIDVLSSVVNIALSLLLIPRYGALGAAVSSTVTMVVYNVLNHLGLLLGTGINLFEKRSVTVYVSIVVGAAALLLLDSLLHPHVVVSIAAAALVSVALLRINRRALDVQNMFPEVLRLPLVRPILGYRGSES